MVWDSVHNRRERMKVEALLYTVAERGKKGRAERKNNRREREREEKSRAGL